MKRRCPKCHGTICRFGNREKPFLCRTCKAWYSKEEVAVKSSRADKIRDMSDEELAEWLVSHDMKCFDDGHLSKDGYVDWLKQEVEE